MSTSGFQSFDDVASPAQGTERIPLLRAELARRGLDGFVVPRADEHQSEYVPPAAERLQWLTGFTGSAGTAVVLTDKAALVVDGRYTLQAAAQVDALLISPVAQAETTLEAWIEAHLPKGGRLGYDPWLHTSKSVTALAKAVERAGGELVAVQDNPVDAAWADRPAPPRAAAWRHPPERAGEASEAKLARVRDTLAADRIDALLVSDPHNLAWLFNIRGADIAHTPLALGYAIVPVAERPIVLRGPDKLTGDVRAALGEIADVAAPETLGAELRRIARPGTRVRVDEATGSEALRHVLAESGATADIAPDPITRLKAVKNAAEIDGARAAHRRDGSAFVRFLHWLDLHAPGGELTEIAAAQALERFRVETGLLRDLSFPTIAGSGPNGAIVHYRVTRATDRALRPGELFLVDSGGQYEDGTTDITRTVAIGTPAAEMRDRFTRVLRGHIAIARAVFPTGTSGAQLDAFARRPLWEAGLDFDHGTGHGVGSYLSVHEGPQRLSKLGHATLESGMIVSNEPGYYKVGAYGIRIENLVLVVPADVPGGERPMLGFETLTLAPICRRLIDRELMLPDETAWLDAYHARVREELSAHLSGADRAWLETATAPL